MIPFFVADRPASLSILKGVLLRHPNTRVGIMTHVFTSKNLHRIFAEFPFQPGLLHEDEKLVRNESVLAESLVKMTDSGIFSKDGCTIDYDELFCRYEEIRTDYGIIIDVFRDAMATLKSAERALRAYDGKRKRRSFKLVAVAQGNNIEEYLECFRKLRENFEYIAIGGLLRKRENTARYVYVRNKDLLRTVLESIRKEFNPPWIFALGCYHPSRHQAFEHLGVWGSDYKGWIFQYQHKRDLVHQLTSSLSHIGPSEEVSQRFAGLITLTNNKRSKLLSKERQWRTATDKRKKRDFWKRIGGLRKELRELHDELLDEGQNLARRNHLPREHRDALRQLARLVSQNEQRLRFAQTRRYIEEHVYAHLE